ncbi:MAG: ImmA/IrrE family metallo-endopeptidase [Chloroflexi bacterium]|nr:ImmA/IrrE family metallo-endopeptidase [Chloroflexota bacterium]
MALALFRPQFMDEAEGRALAIRDELGLGSDALGDVFELLDHLGLAVVRWPMGEEGPDGFYITRQELSVVAVNSAKRLGRQRFTACHELGHHLFDRRSRIDRNVLGASTVPERRANAFAAFFLMPAAGVRRWLERDSRRAQGSLSLDAPAVVHLARHFGMSYEAALYQLRALGTLSSRQILALRKEQPERLARILGYDVDVEAQERHRRVLPPDFVSRSLKAYGAADISLGRLAELLRTDEETARRIASEAGIEPAEPALEIQPKSLARPVDYGIILPISRAEARCAWQTI